MKHYCLFMLAPPLLFLLEFVCSEDVYSVFFSKVEICRVLIFRTRWLITLFLLTDNECTYVSARVQAMGNK